VTVTGAALATISICRQSRSTRFIYLYCR